MSEEQKTRGYIRREVNKSRFDLKKINKDQTRNTDRKMKRKEGEIHRIYKASRK